jgi:hypothetical protein
MVIARGIWRQCPVGFIAAVILSGVLASSAGADDDPNVIESFDVGGNGDFLLIPVLIEGREHRFILDTCASANIFDAALESTLKATGKREPVNGKGSYKVFDGSTATVGRAGFPVFGKTTCMDLGPTRDGLGCSFDCKFDGALGMPFLQDKIVQINFDAGCLSFLKTSDGIPGEKIAITRGTRGFPIVRVDLPGIRGVPFLIDTGHKVFDNGSLCKSTLDKLVRARHAALVDTVVVRGANAEHNERVVTLDSLSVGGFTHDAQTFGEDSRNILGLGYLSRYTVTFDFPGQRLILDKGNQFDRNFPRNVTGLLMVRTESGLVVSYAQEGRTGHSCGVRKGDTLLEVNGESTNGKSAYDVMRILREGPEGAVLKISRTGAAEPQRIRLTSAASAAADSRR